ncbi:MAG: glycosyltransferase [Actinomyces sp.]|nr:MAG: glycosyltransferase [Actinomyces sp.]
MSEPRPSVLIVTWRTRAVTVPRVMAALDAVEPHDGEVVVVDNASGDGTAEALAHLAQAEPRLRVLANPDNRGFAAANQQAYELSDGDVVLVVNPDIDLTRRAVARLCDLVSSPDVGLASCLLVGPDGRPQHLHRRFPTPARALFTLTAPGAWVDHRLRGRRHARAARHLDRPRVGLGEVDQVAGALIAVRRDVVEGPLGGMLFDPELPILVNDVDLSRRVAAAGLRRLVDWDLAVTHVGSVSLRQLDRRRLDRELRRGLRLQSRRHDPPVRRLLLGAALALPPPPRPDDRPGGDPGTPAPPEVPEHAPVVSVVIPAHDYAHTLDAAIDSALTQTVDGSPDRVEVIVVDDGSTDHTPEVIAARGSRIRSHRQPNRGLSAARNTGARLARGDYVVFLDADDTLDPRFVEATLSALRAHPAAGYAYTQVHHRGTGERVTDLDPFDLDRLLDRNEIAATALIRRHLVLEHPYDEANRLAYEDWDFYLTLAEHGWGGVLVDEPLLNYRRHEVSMLATLDALRRRRALAHVLRRHRRLVGWRRVLSAEWRLQRLRWGLARRRLTARRRGQLDEQVPA